MRKMFYIYPHINYFWHSSFFNVSPHFLSFFLFFFWRLKQQKCIFSQFWRLGSPRQRCWLIQFLVRTLFLVCPWFPSLCVLIWDRAKQACVSAYKDTNPANQGSIPLTSLNLNYFLTPNSTTLEDSHIFK